MGLNQSTALLSSRAIQGMFWEEMARLSGDQSSLLNRIALEATSDQSSEQYGWLGQVPQMSEWIGERQLAKLRASDYTIKNKHFESSILIPESDMRRDKTPQLRVRIAGLADSAGLHMYELVIALINAGETSLCYDDQFFYDTDHLEGESGAQSNDLALTAVSSAAPTQVEMANIIIQMLEAVYGFKDDRGRAMNRTARQFVLVVPVTYWGTAVAAVSNNILGGTNGVATSSPLNTLPVSIDVVAEPDLGTAKKLYLNRTDGRMKPFIGQTEEGTMQLKSKAEGSEHAFDTATHAHGVDVWHNAGYGLWQYSVLATISDE